MVPFFFSLKGHSIHDLRGPRCRKLIWPESQLVCQLFSLCQHLSYLLILKKKIQFINKLIVQTFVACVPSYGFPLCHGHSVSQN